ncbi:hypothetical protein B296_00000969 [Ensete ventricosum]|uniref:Uncharacterized protein n=1 Tax=Ensete ventricosum TaxID=4639 RepID=A0A427B199_ENSVE|nr:hypothetical protein B296_00000969 [Ensete ventricosum]
MALRETLFEILEVSFDGTANYEYDLLSKLRCVKVEYACRDGCLRGPSSPKSREVILELTWRAVARLPLHCSFSFGVSLSEEEVDVSNTQTAEVNAEKSLSRVLP